MVDHEVETQLVAAETGPDTGAKRAACLECRKGKIKCIRNADESICKKCQSTGTECIVPEYHVGRYKGVKNKRSGLEKAIYQVEEAVKKARTGSDGVSDQHAKALQKLLEDAAKVNGEHITSSHSPENRHQYPNDKALPAAAAESPGPPGSAPFSLQEHAVPHIPDADGEVLVDNADNPLQLLAIASAIPDSTTATTPYIVGNTPPGAPTVVSTGDEDAQDFFGPLVSKLDVGSDVDPVELGLVTLREADVLLKYFHDHLSHTRWGLDETLHSVAFVRSRSAFLFTSVLASSALFLPDTAALSKRLNNHCKGLAQKISSDGYRSLEIVLAFMVNIPWMQPGKTWTTGDNTCYYLSTALTIALDLSLNKIVTPSWTIRLQGAMEKVSSYDRIDVRRALDIDGHVNVEQGSDIARRLIRVRERVWLALFNLDRGVCLARGRPWTVPAGPLVDTCDAWHLIDNAVRWDGSLVAAVVLRRDFGNLVSDVRQLCDRNQETGLGDGNGVVKTVRERVEGFFSSWESSWSHQIRQADGAIPPYVEILVSHGKLSAYCNVINHCTATTELRRFFRAAGLTSALNVLRVAVQSEEKLKSMPNNTVIMVSFAACFVLGLSTSRHGDQIYLAANAKRSIQEAADVLERIGSWPEHRKGASALFGRHIKRIMKQHTAPTESTNAYHLSSTADNTSACSHQNGYANTPFTLHSTSDTARNSFPGFESMTDEQMLAAIQSANVDIDNFNAGFEGEDLFMDWLEWPTLS